MGYDDGKMQHYKVKFMPEMLENQILDKGKQRVINVYKGRLEICMNRGK